MASHSYTPIKGEVGSIPALLSESAVRWGGKPALWRWVDARFESVSYTEVVHSAALMADRLRAVGVGPGQRVAVWVVDRFSWGMAYLGVLWTGATVVPIDPALTPVEIAGIITQSESRCIVADDAAAADLLTADVRTIPLADIWAGFPIPSEGALPPVPEIAIDSLASILFTSGTTGDAKGVMLSHGNIVSDILAVRTMCLCGPDDILLSVLPIHHAFECTGGFLYPLSIGAQVAYARSLKSNEIVADLKSTRATVLLGVPLLYEKMARGIQRRVGEAGPIRRTIFGMLYGFSRRAGAVGLKRAGHRLFASMRIRAGLGTLRMVVSGGAALPLHVAEFFEAIGLPMIQGYGLSEASPVVTINRPGAHRLDTVGPPLPGVKVRIRDPRPDGTGEVVVSGPMVMKGYWRRPEVTARTLQDGWLMTGDLGAFDPDGHLRIVGRSKNVIISGAGKNIYPEEIETMLEAQPEIAESLVYGQSRPGKIGETVAAIVVPDSEWFETSSPGLLADPSRLQAAVAEAIRRACLELASYKRIAEWEMRSDPFERTSTRKIKRYLVLDESPFGPAGA